MDVLVCINRDAKKCLRSLNSLKMSTKFHALNSLVSLTGIPVIRTFDKRGGTPSLQTATTKVRNIYM